MRVGKYRSYLTLTQDQIASSGTKYCGKCSSIKPIKEFASRKRVAHGLSSWCILCNRQYDKEHAARFRNRRRDRWYKVTYGIVYKTFLKIVGKQLGLCALCEQYMEEPHLDHDAATGRIRGALCHRCNVGLGHFDDDPELLRRAILYLGEEEWKSHSTIKL